MPDRSKKSHRTILHDMLCLPTAPFAEHFVIEHILAFCAARKNLFVTRDAVGNLLVRLRQGGARVARPVCITAHLDHPGFVAERMIGAGKVRAFWRGGVPKEYFVNSGVRFFVDGRWVRGRIRTVKIKALGERKRVHTAEIDVARDVPEGAIGMWDFPDPQIRGSRIHARGCDDIAGASAMLCCIDTLCRSRQPCDAYFLFTRAEEVGFVGAIAAARRKTIPKKCFVVAMETSSERPNAKLGDGPILRVGDRTTTFTHAATAHCLQAALAVGKADKKFKFQRRLMDGGTCESSAYCALGYEATGLCVALGNYHNVDGKRKKLAPEYIDLNDFDNMVKWFVELARGRLAYTGQDTGFVKQLAETETYYEKLLNDTIRPRPNR